MSNYEKDINDIEGIDEFEVDEIEEIEEIEEVEEIDLFEEEESEDAEDSINVPIGSVSGCSKLNVRFRPNSNSDIVCTIDYNTEVMIDESESTNEYYKVYTSSGIEGFCIKKYIDIKA